LTLIHHIGSLINLSQKLNSVSPLRLKTLYRAGRVTFCTKREQLRISSHKITCFTCLVLQLSYKQTENHD